MQKTPSLKQADSISQVNKFIRDNKSTLTDYINNRYRGFSMFPYRPDFYEDDVIDENPVSWEYSNRNKKVILMYKVHGWIHSMLKRIFHSYSKTKPNRTVIFMGMSFKICEQTNNIVFYMMTGNINNNKIVNDYIDTALIELKLNGVLLPNSYVGGSISEILKALNYTLEVKCTH